MNVGVIDCNSLSREAQPIWLTTCGIDLRNLICSEQSGAKDSESYSACELRNATATYQLSNTKTARQRDFSFSPSPPVLQDWQQSSVSLLFTVSFQFAPKTTKQGVFP